MKSTWTTRKLCDKLLPKPVRAIQSGSICYYLIRVLKLKLCLACRSISCKNWPSEAANKADYFGLAHIRKALIIISKTTTFSDDKIRSSNERIDIFVQSFCLKNYARQKTTVSSWSKNNNNNRQLLALFTQSAFMCQCVRIRRQQRRFPIQPQQRSSSLITDQQEVLWSDFEYFKVGSHNRPRQTNTKLRLASMRLETFDSRCEQKQCVA